MMDIQKMLDDYSSWLRKEISVSKHGEYYELTTPFLDRFNDYLQIYVKQNESGEITLTDDGYIIGNLLSSGISLGSNSKRKAMLDRILRNYSMELVNDSITTNATIQDFPQKKHHMVQAMLSIDDIFEVSREKIENFFIEDMQTFFDKNNIFYSRDFSLIGKTGSLYTYEFHFQRTKNNPERFCKPLNKLREQSRNLTIFNWLDTKEKRHDEGKLIVVLNDTNTIETKDIDALKRYDIIPVMFSECNKNLDLFEAA